jgi:transcriptional regulator with XRE-family HTH domain
MKKRGLASPTAAEQDAIIQWMANCSEDELQERFRDKEWRYLADSVFSYWRIRNQIRAVRLQRGYTQAQLGELAGMEQSFISRLENIYLPEELTIDTLRRIAYALDVRLSVKFTSWGEALRDILHTLSPLRVADAKTSLNEGTECQ